MTIDLFLLLPKIVHDIFIFYGCLWRTSERWRIQHRTVFPAAPSHPWGAKRRKVVSLQSTGWKFKAVSSLSPWWTPVGLLFLGKHSKLVWPRPWAAWSNFEVKSNFEASPGLSIRFGHMSSRGPLQLKLFYASRSSSQCHGIKTRTGFLIFVLVLSCCFVGFGFFLVSITMTTITELFSRIN